MIENRKTNSYIIFSFSRYDILRDKSQSQELSTMDLEDIYRLQGVGTEEINRKKGK